MNRKEAIKFSEKGNYVLRKIETFPIPVIFIAGGPCRATCLQISLSCDIRISSDDAQFGLPEVSYGIMPGFGGTQRLARILGPGMAKQLIYTGGYLESKEALKYGLVNAIYPKDTLLVGAAATDEAFLRLLQRHDDVIHLSTHGYYGGRIGIYNDIKPLLNDESMSKSGLLFAGATNTLGDANFDENLFDGVLSATELSKQDFSHTELIVLSACQTGLGHLTDDGIYGVQRGLKMAGANAMILTLWSVSDDASNLLMRFFYEELEKQPVKDIHSAFFAARQRLMREEKKVWVLDSSTLTTKEELRKYDTPQYINPFIIIDAY